MQRKAPLLFLPAPRRVRGEFEREHPLIYGVKLTQLAGLGGAHFFDLSWIKKLGEKHGGTTTPPMCPLSIKQNAFFKKPFGIGVSRDFRDFVKNVVFPKYV